MAGSTFAFRSLDDLEKASHKFMKEFDLNGYISLERFLQIQDIDTSLIPEEVEDQHYRETHGWTDTDEWQVQWYVHHQDSNESTMHTYLLVVPEPRRLF